MNQAEQTYETDVSLVDALTGEAFDALAVFGVVEPGFVGSYWVEGYATSVAVISVNDGESDIPSERIVGGFEAIEARIALELDEDGPDE